MAVPIPDWLLGRGITTIQVTAQVFSGGRLTTPAGAQQIDFFTVVDGIQYEHEVELLDVAPTSSRQRNMVILTTGGTFTITELLRRSGPAQAGSFAFNSLAALFHNFDYFRLVLTRGGGSFSFYGVNAGYRETITRGKSTGEGRFAPVGTVAAGVSPSRNPVYQAA